MTTVYYDRARALDPGTGDYAVDTGTATYRTGQPMAEVLVRVLRTPRGRYLPDPTYGLDLAAVRLAPPLQQATQLQAEILRALRPWTARGLLTRVLAVTERRPSGALLYDVSFADPRDPQRAPAHVTGSV